MSARAWLQSRTRSQMFLWQMTIGILAAGFAVALALSFVHKPDVDPSLIDLLLEQVAPLVPQGGISDEIDTEELDERMRKLVAEGLDVAGTIDPWLADHAADTGRVLDALPALGQMATLNPSYDLEAAVARAIPAGDGRDVLVEYLRSRATGQSSDVLRQMAEREPPVRWANHAVGMLMVDLATPDQAAAAYEREGRHPDAAVSRRRAVELYLEAEAFDDLRRLSVQPAYADAMAATVNFELALHDRDWFGVLRWVWPARFDHIDPGWIVLGVCSGLFWLLFLLHAGEVRGPRDVRLWLCVVGLAFGAVSVAPCLFVYTWMEHALGFTFGPEPDLRQGLLYCMVGIGLNEELCKLLLVVPLAPILVRRGNALEMLIVCSCVGLGFAAEENIAWFAGSAGGDAPGRFLTANFFHLTATGLTGFALCQLLMRPRDRAADFAVIFTGVVVIHGLYDALIMVPALSEFAMFSGTVFILLAYQYFHELRQYRRWTARTVSLTAVFLGGFASLIALTFNYVAWNVGLAPAADALVPGALGVAIIIIMYLRQINEPLSP